MRGLEVAIWVNTVQNMWQTKGKQLHNHSHSYVLFYFLSSLKQFSLLLDRASLHKLTNDCTPNQHTTENAQVQLCFMAYEKKGKN